MMSKKVGRSQAFDVFRITRDLISRKVVEHKIDTVFYAEGVRMTVDDARRDLVEHDGYPPDIIVRKAG